MSDPPAAEEGNGGNVAEGARSEWSGWTHPAESAESAENREDDGSDGDQPERAPWKAPPAERPETLRERIRQRYGFTDRQWYVIETLLLVAPYPLFVLVYLYVPVDELSFLLVTLLYSLVAMYVGLLS